ncbi:hypothetical protein BJV78DRAFT_790048 [Lactifluus subvellereus]|nr:hypothetical protein BJV78DRAFT_790048 [Lactifluus subvellereus]
MSQPPTHEAAQPLSESSVLPSPIHLPHTTVSSPVYISPALHTRSTDPQEVEGSTSEDRSRQKPWWKRILWKAREGNKRQTPLGEAPSASRSLRAVVKLSWSNVLLICIPLSVSVSYDDLAQVESHT